MFGGEGGGAARYSGRDQLAVATQTSATYLQADRQLQLRLSG